MQVKVLLVRAQKEMRNMLLETGEKGILVIIAPECLVELCLEVIWKVESVNDKLGYLAEEISKQC